MHTKGNNMPTSTALTRFREENKKRDTMKKTRQNLMNRGTLTNSNKSLETQKVGEKKPGITTTKTKNTSGEQSMHRENLENNLKSEQGIIPVSGMTPPTGSSKPLLTLEQEKYLSMNIVDSMITELRESMRSTKEIKALISLGKEIRELIKVKLDAVKVARSLR